MRWLVTRAQGSRGSFSASMYEESGEVQHMWGMRESLTANDKDLSLEMTMRGI